MKGLEIVVGLEWPFGDMMGDAGGIGDQDGVSVPFMDGPSFVPSIVAFGHDTTVPLANLTRCARRSFNQNRFIRQVGIGLSSPT